MESSEATLHYSNAPLPRFFRVRCQGSTPVAHRRQFQFFRKQTAERSPRRPFGDSLHVPFVRNRNERIERAIIESREVPGFEGEFVITAYLGVNNMVRSVTPGSLNRHDSIN